MVHRVISELVTKKNIVLNQILPACEVILAGEKNDNTIEEAVIMLETLIDSVTEVKRLDELVSELTIADDEYDKNE